MQSRFLVGGMTAAPGVTAVPDSRSWADSVGRFARRVGQRQTGEDV